MINNWIKKGIALFATLTIALTGIPLGMIPASAEETDWTGYTTISTKEELNAVRNNLAGKYYLSQDIVFNAADFAEGGAFYNNGAGWAPIGKDDVNAFKGIFDGNKHTISGLYINIKNDSTVYAVYAGLFGCNKGTIEDIGMIGGSITSVSTTRSYIYAGGIAGSNCDSGTINNCYNAAKISATSTSYYSYAGGVTGQNYGGTISNCYNTGYLYAESTSSYAYAGGMAGISDRSSTIRDCYNTGNVNVTTFQTATYAYAGGIAGHNYRSSINNCYNTGNLHASSAYTHIGGIVGDIVDKSTINNCNNTGNIYATSTLSRSNIFAGGLSGQQQGSIISNSFNKGNINVTSPFSTNVGGIGGAGGENTIINCYNTGNVNITSSSYARVGGIEGEGSTSTVSSCYNTGNASVDSSSYASVGGIEGESSTSTVSSCYNTGNVSTTLSNANMGGIMGYSINNGSTINSCYYLDIIPLGVGCGLDTAVPCTLVQMKQQSTFVGFDFNTVWKMSSTYLPYLSAIPYVEAQSMSFTNSTVELGTGGTYQTELIVNPSIVTFLPVEYTSQNPEIASVDQKGMVKGVSCGKANIIARDTLSGKAALLVVTVKQGVTGISISGSNQINVGEKTQLAAAISPDDAANKEIKWNTSDASLATVDENGLVTGLRGGTVAICAESKDGTNVQTTFNMNIIRNPDSISINKSQVELKIGDIETLTATVLPSDTTNKNILWSTSDNKIAAVEEGKVTAKGLGTATITAKTEDGGLFSQCIVKVIQPVNGITLNKSEATIAMGTSQTLVATISPSNATYQNCIWTSNNACVTVNQQGVITGVSEGTAVITVETEDGHKTAICVVTVGKPVTKITINKLETTLIEGLSESLTVNEVLPKDAINKNVVWSSSNGNVVTVDQNGKITAVQTGNAKIFATAVDGTGKTATFDATVVAKSLTGIAVTTKPTKLTFIEGTALDTTGMILTLTYDNGTTETVTSGWTTGYDFSTPGTRTVTVFYSGKITSFDATVVAKSLTSITVTTKPTKLTYIKGTPLDTTGMVLTLAYDNGTAETVTSGWTTNYDFSALGTCTVTVSYGGNTTTFDVMVLQYIPGDVNDDGVVNSKDVTILRRYLANWQNIMINVVAADVNKDGVVNSKDDTLLRRYIAGWDVELL